MTVPAGYSYAGNGSSGIDIEYIQNETGRFPTSRILTAGSAITRAADGAIRTLSSEYSATAGSMFVSGDTFEGTATVPCQIDDTTSSNRILLYKQNPSGNMRSTIVTATVSQGDTGAGASFGGGSFNCAMAWANNSMQMQSSGVLGTEDVSITLPTATSLWIGAQAGPSAQINGHVRRFEYRPERLNDTILRGL